MFQQFVVLVLAIQSSSPELFSSTSHMYSAVHAERELAQVLRNCTVLHEKERTIEKLKVISNNMETHSLNTINEPARYVANPLAAFLFAKRFTLDWEHEIAPLLNEKVLSETDLRRIKELREYLPSDEDLEGVAAALFRIHDTYRLNATRLAEGFIHERYIHRLSAEDCYVLGRLAYSMEKYKHVYIWMEVSLQKQRSEIIRDVTRLELLDYAIHGREMEEDYEKALLLTNEQLTLDPNLRRAVNRKENYVKILRHQDENKNSNYKYSETDAEKNIVYPALCRGEGIKHQYKYRLSCRYYDNNRHPMLVLEPVKQEILRTSPEIVLYHDVISDSEIDDMKTLSASQLTRSLVFNSGKMTTSYVRISKSMYVAHTQLTSGFRIMNRLESITGLSLQSSEEFQIANYGIGGYYVPHRDTVTDKDNIDFSLEGNRIATWLNYLNDVEEGGATVFPSLGVRILPEKGTGVFWYNLYRNGEPNHKLLHAACPVLIGSKWVSTYWIREKEQMFRRPCSTDPTQ